MKYFLIFLFSFVAYSASIQTGVLYNTNTSIIAQQGLILSNANTIRVTNTITSNNGIFTNGYFGGTIINVLDPRIGGIGNGVVDDTGAFQRAIDAVSTNQGGTIILPGNKNYLITSTLSITNHGVHILGESLYPSRITFSGTGPLFSFSRSTAVIFDCSVERIQIVGSGASQKIAFRLTDTSSFIIRDVNVESSWTGNNSIGIQYRGRELALLDHVKLYCDQPISIEDNPNSTIDVDHFHLYNSTIVTKSSTNAAIEIASGVNITTFIVDGRNSWNLGKYGIHWNDTTSTTSSARFFLENIIMEQAQDTNGWGVFIEHNHGVNGIYMNNCETFIATSGIHLRKANNITLQNMTFGSGNSIKPLALDIDNTCEDLKISNCLFDTSVITSLTGLTEIYSMPTFASLQPLSSDAYYRNNIRTNTGNFHVYGSLGLRNDWVKFWAQANGELTLVDNTGSAFNMLRAGTNTAAGPGAIKFVAQGVSFRKGDDSAGADVYANDFTQVGNFSQLATDLSLYASGGIKWSSTAAYNGSKDVGLVRDSAGFLRISNGSLGRGGLIANTLTVGSATQFGIDINGNITKLNNVTYSFPASQGAASTILQNNGSGTLTWVAPGAGTSGNWNAVGTTNSSLAGGAFVHNLTATNNIVTTNLTVTRYGKINGLLDFGPDWGVQALVVAGTINTSYSRVRIIPTNPSDTNVVTIGTLGVGTDGTFVLIEAEPGYNFTIQHNAGNILNNPPVDFILDENTTALAIYDARSSMWHVCLLGGQVTPPYTTLADGATITWTVNRNYSVQNAKVTLGGNRTLAFSGIKGGMTGTLIVIQDGTGSRTLTLPGSSKVISGGTGAITLTATAAAVDILTWTYDGTSYYWNYGKNYN